MADGVTVVGPCGPGKQKVAGDSKIPVIAQLYAMVLFQADFHRRFPLSFVSSEWDLVGRVVQKSGIRAIDVALNFIKSDFRNYYSKGKGNRQLLKKGVPASGLREGRPVRADGMGIAIDPVQQAIVCELLEVTTEDEAQGAILEDLQPKLALLRGPIKTLVEAELARLSTEMSFAAVPPRRLLASGTPWIIPPHECVVPLFTNPDAAQSGSYEWICFAPTYALRPMVGAFALTEPEQAPARGLILYSYHKYTQRSLVPDRVLRKYTEWAVKQARMKGRLDLLPAPVIADYWYDNIEDLKLVLGYLAAATLAVGAVVLAIYLAPVVMGAAAALLADLAAAASIEAIMAGLGALTTAIGAYLPQIVNFARTTMVTLSNLGPRYATSF